MPRQRAKTFVHVNQHVIRRNQTTGEREPPITVRRGRRGKAERVHEVLIDGPIWLKYSPDAPLPCGARVWLELQEGAEILSTLGNSGVGD